MFAAIVTFAMLYVLLIENPLFLANSNANASTSAGKVSVSPFLPSAQTASWSTSGFAYACGGSGPGALQITNNGQGTVTISSVFLTYGGMTYSATGPSCSVPPGNSLISITALGASAPTRDSTYQGYVQTSDGTKINFVGTWQ